jgi:ribosomal protein S3AE
MRILAAALLAAAMSVSLTPASAATSQQEKMKTCNADAAKKDLKGDARKSFMKECLSEKKEETAATLTKQQQKMKDCNADAKTQKLQGDARKAFMKSCLSDKSAPPAN